MKHLHFGSCSHPDSSISKLDSERFQVVCWSPWGSQLTPSISAPQTASVKPAVTPMAHGGCWYFSQGQSSSCLTFLIAFTLLHFPSFWNILCILIFCDSTVFFHFSSCSFCVHLAMSSLVLGSFSSTSGWLNSSFKWSHMHACSWLPFPPTDDFLIYIFSSGSAMGSLDFLLSYLARSLSSSHKSEFSWNLNFLSIHS